MATTDIDGAEPSQGEASTAGPVLYLGAYEGPIDLLLELARAQRVDLTQVSIVNLAEQFGTAVETAIARRAVPLSQLGEWLVTAAWLTLLRSRLLLPPEVADAKATLEAEGLRKRLDDRRAIRLLAEWLEQRPQLGRDVFGRGIVEPEAAGPLAANVTELLRACLRLLARPSANPVYRPPLPALWRVPEALAHLRSVLAQMPPEGVPLRDLLPAVEPRMVTPLQRRAALASTLMAGLELTREGLLTLEQDNSFGGIRVLRASPPAMGLIHGKPALR